MSNEQIAGPTRVINEINGLAIYEIGQGEPLLFMPYPHASATAATADTKLAAILAGLPRQVLTFDPPGAYRSTRPSRADLPEILDCALETLNAGPISEPVDVIGHSMSSLCALALELNIRPECGGWSWWVVSPVFRRCAVGAFPTTGAGGATRNIGRLCGGACAFLPAGTTWPSTSG